MFYKDTNELKNHVYDVYEKLRPLADASGIFKPLDVCFSEKAPMNFEGVYCYTDKKGYHYCCTERGVVQLNNQTSSLFEITYWVFKSPISNMASSFECKNRIEGQDFRRIMFQKELELFEVLGGNYRKRAEIDIDEILKVAPYQDDLF